MNNNPNANKPNPWVVQQPKVFQPLPTGAYMARFTGVEDFQLQNEAKWKWKWEVVSGQHTVKLATALTNQGINVNTICGRLIQGLLGRMPNPGEGIKDAVDDCVGNTYWVMVGPGPKGGKPGVQSVSTPPPM